MGHTTQTHKVVRPPPTPMMVLCACSNEAISTLKISLRLWWCGSGLAWYDGEGVLLVRLYSMIGWFERFTKVCQ